MPEAEKTTEVVQNVVDNLPSVISETRKGYKTTEFWLTILSVVAVNLDAIPVPDKYKPVVSALVVAAYTISRGIAKKGVPDVKPGE